MNQYNVTKTQQIAIDAESPEDAAKRVLNGEGTTPGVTITVQLRPPPGSARPTVIGGRPNG